MEEKDELGVVVIAALRNRVTNILPAQIRACLDQLSDEQLWWRPNEQSNSVGNLVLHVSGSLRHFLCRGVGGFEYQRDRPAEFAERGPVSRSQLLATFDEMVRQATLTFDALQPVRLIEPSEDASSNIIEVIVGVAIHLATHAGQIVYVTKLLNEGALDEVWIQTHRAAAKPKV